MSQKTLLDAIEIASPCSEEWNGMTGGDAVRFCSHCAKDVHNISAMTRKRARKLVAESNGNLCVRYLRRPDGRIETLKRQFVRLTRQTGIAASALGATVSLAGAVYAQGGISISASDISNLPVVAAKEKSDAPNGTISGTISDPNGAVVGFALVTLSNSQINFYQSTNTNQEGFYEFKDVPAGDYALKVDAAGFDSKEFTKISVSGDTAQNAQLVLPTMQQVVEVNGNELPVSYTTMGLIVLVERRNKLIAAVENGDIEKVIERVSIGDRINAKDKSYGGNAALHVAVENGNVEIARYLLSAGAKANAKNAEKRTPLMMIDEDSNADMIRVLLQYGAKINALDRAGNTALILAAESADAEVVQLLLSAGANLNAQNTEGRTALLNAAEAKNAEAVKLLLGAGANPNAEDGKGETAMSLSSDSDEIKQLLVAYGAREK